jgi:hypothetical protein
MLMTYISKGASFWIRDATWRWDKTFAHLSKHFTPTGPYFILVLESVT